MNKISNIPWDINQISEAKIYCAKIYNNIFPELNHSLNKYHKISWDRQQYEKLLGNWVFNFIEILYDRWFYPGKYLANSDELITYLSSDIIDFGNNCISDGFNSTINNHLMYIKDNSQLKHVFFPEKIGCLQNFEISQFNDSLIQIHNQYHLNQRRGISGWFDYNYKSWMLRGLAQDLNILLNKPVSVNVDKIWRLSLLKNKITSFSEVCKILLRIYMPIVFLEGFKALKKCADKYCFRITYTANSTHFDIPFKFMIANWDNKTKLLCHQHGGGYGIDLSCQGEKYDRSISDIFYTWGWIEDRKTHPLPSPPRIRKYNRKKSKKLLLTCVNYPKYLYKLNYYHIGQNTLTLINNTINFVKITKHLNLEISYYHSDYNWDVRSRFEKEDAIIPEKSLNYGDYSLYICNYLGTSWLETLAANLPTICFYDQDIIAFRKAVKPHIDLLKNMGVLHTSPESAAEKVLETYRNPSLWWANSEIQEARKEFVKKYALFDDKWLVHWRDEFSKVLND
ncbi:MAG: hypothetical protein CMG74_07505 [Candidatus Marinimicrobia bacterium]|nr:hypothetical protein [Candidatus Neomarinimicrobiota bacterium]